MVVVDCGVVGDDVVADGVDGCCVGGGDCAVGGIVVDVCAGVCGVGCVAAVVDVADVVDIVVGSDVGCGLGVGDGCCDVYTGGGCCCAGIADDAYVGAGCVIVDCGCVDAIGDVVYCVGGGVSVGDVVVVGVAGDDVAGCIDVCDDADVVGVDVCV